MFEATACTETVSILRAIVLGTPDGACIALSMWSVLSILLPFAAAVMALQWIANRLIYGPGGKGGSRTAADPYRPKAGQVLSRTRRATGE